MCGIAGIAEKSKSNIDMDILRRMAHVLRHRGPDDEGFYHHGAPGPSFSVALAHRRLSIIDLSRNAHQPMSNEDGRLWLVYNGEIYNFRRLKDELADKGHVFKSRADSEVIIHLYEEYGEGCLDYLRGAFAFCLWDAKENTLFLARDRVGMKPLVYFYDGETFIFASELKALLEDKRVPRDLDFTAIADFFTYGYIPSPKTVFKKILKLPPAHTLLLDKNGIRLKRYWQPDYNDKIIFRKDADYGEKIAELFNEAVRLRLVSDVPLGVFLSGGIDSSSVLSFMAKNVKSPVKSFSIGFEEDSYNELEYASSMARKYATEHREFIVRIDAVKILPKLAWYYNEPFADSSAVPTYLVSQKTREFVKVALSGDGGDEAFGGYNRYVAFRFLAKKGLLNRVVSAGTLGLLNLARPVFHGSKSYSYARRLTESALFSGEAVKRYLYIMGFFPRLGILTDKFFEHTKGYDNSAYFRNIYDMLDIKDVRESPMKLDFFTNLPEDLMVKADIAAMANSLEVRSPFLDHKLLEFALRIPFDKKIKFLRTKVILKDYLRKSGLLTDEILKRRKQGFAVPIGEWFKKDLAGFLKGLLSESVFIKEGFFDKKAIDSLIEEHTGEARDHTHRLWSILNFEMWHKIFMENVSPDELVRT